MGIEIPPALAMWADVINFLLDNSDVGLKKFRLEKYRKAVEEGRGFPGSHQ